MKEFIIKYQRVLVDDQDAWLLEQYKWYLKHDRDTVYLKTQIDDGSWVYLHELIINRKNKLIDHIDRNALNNCRSNLRVVTKSQNAMNSRLRADNTSGIKGISYRRDRGTWHVYITKDQKRTHVGNFHTLNEAIKARLKIEKKMFGQYANTDLLKQMEDILNG